MWKQGARKLPLMFHKSLRDEKSHREGIKDLVLIKRPQHRGAKFAQPEPCRARQAKLVICDHTIDITYIRLLAGWLYLVAILDWHSR
jgi:transposase InsO family protein